MNKRMSRTIFLIFLFFGIALPSYSANLRLEIVASDFENSGLNHLKVDYHIGSSTDDILLKPFSYGWILTKGWEGSALALEPDNTLHFCVDEKGDIYPHGLIYWQGNIAKDHKLYPQSKYNTKYINLVPIYHGENLDRRPSIYKTNNRYFRFCLVNVKNESYVVSNLYSFSLNSDSEIYDAKTIHWSEMSEAAQKAMETLIITKAKELKESFTPEIIIDQINHWENKK